MRSSGNGETSGGIVETFSLIISIGTDRASKPARARWEGCRSNAPTSSRFETRCFTIGQGGVDWHLRLLVKNSAAITSAQHAIWRELCYSAAMQFRLTSNTTLPCRGLSLVEIVISLALTSLSVAAIVDGYVLCAKQAEGSALHLAAQAQALERLEQTRAAKWDPNASPVVDDVTSGNFLPIILPLDVPSPRVQRFATNITSVRTISTIPPLKAIRIETIWGWNGRLYTNVVSTYRGPDQ